MHEWSGRIRTAVGLGLLWGLLWTGAGALVRQADRSGSLDRLWLGPAIGWTPGLLAGVLFSVMLGIAASRRRLEELSVAIVLACGGVAGLLVGMLPFAINEPPSEAALWLVGLVVLGSMALLGSVSAAGSLALARGWRAARR